MPKLIEMPVDTEKSFAEIYEMFVVAQTAKGVTDATLRNYHYHMRRIAKHLDISQPMSQITKRDLERAVLEMRNAGIKHNSIATYVRLLKTFLNWCNREELLRGGQPVPER